MSLPALPEDLPRHFLKPCMIFAHREPHLVSTLLGSCVSVCLWDTRWRCGGMNHFMLPLWNGNGLPTPKFGNIAIDLLVERMVNLGSRRENLVAKVFGGASVVEADPGIFDIGNRNATLALDALEQHRIPVRASALGGYRGLKVIFDTRTGDVLVGRLGSASPGA